MSNTEKLFLASWPEGYYKAEDKIVRMADFTEDKGYTELEIENIDKLHIGQSYIFADVFDYFVVTRLS